MSPHSVISDEEVGGDDEFFGFFVFDIGFGLNKMLIGFEELVPVAVDGGGVFFPELVHVVGVGRHAENVGGDSEFGKHLMNGKINYDELFKNIEVFITT